MAQELATWKAGLFDCFEDAGSCCYGFWCCPCLACTVAGRFEENRCLPLCDMCSFGIAAFFGVPLFVPPAALGLRVGIRKKYGIQGSICRDIFASCCCAWCSWCQMHRELRYHLERTTVIVNMQPAAVTVAVPPVVMQQNVVTIAQ